MKTIPLSKNGEQVSEFCLGVMYYGTRVGEALSCHLMDRYVAAGGSSLDTANIYAHWVPGFQGGESETVVGRWMRARGYNLRFVLVAAGQLSHWSPF